MLDFNAMFNQFSTSALLFRTAFPLIEKALRTSAFGHCFSILEKLLPIPPPWVQKELFSLKNQIQIKSSIQVPEMYSPVGITDKMVSYSSIVTGLFLSSGLLPVHISFCYVQNSIIADRIFSARCISKYLHQLIDVFVWLFLVFPLQEKYIISTLSFNHRCVIISRYKNR